jgi:hypothetical protein
MGLSRKRERELKRLRNSAQDLWGDQKQVLDHASRVVREAGKQVKQLGREEVAPRVRDTIDHRIMPTVVSARTAADTTRDKLAHEVLPSVASAVASALAVIEVAKDARVKEALREVRKASDKLGNKVQIIPQKSSAGPGRFILLGLGLVAFAGVAYAAWQTFRDDEDLWVSDETEDFTTATEPQSL